MEQSFETNGPLRLDLQVPEGRIEVVAGDTGTTEVRLEGPDELLERATIELRGDELRVQVRERRGSFIRLDGDELFLHVRCPDGSSLDARTKSADVAATGRLAAVRFESASGRLSVDRAGSVSAQSASGEVAIGEATGDLSVQVVSGAVRVREAARAVRISGVSGGVRLEAVAGGRVQVETVSGDIEVGIRRGSRVHVDASSISGRTRSDLDLGETPGGEDEGPLVELRVQTVSGDIAVVRAPALTPHVV